MAAENTYRLSSDSAVMMPAANAFAITPDNEEELEFVTRGIYVGTAGDLAVVLAGDSEAVTFVSLVAGVIHPLRVRQVLATGTDAEDIVGVY